MNDNGKSVVYQKAKCFRNELIFSCVLEAIEPVISIMGILNIANLIEQIYNSINQEGPWSKHHHKKVASNKRHWERNQSNICS
jgi:hypothetical protein